MQLGLFSISYGGLWGQATLDLRTFVRRASNLGFDAIMLAGKRPHLSTLDFDDAVISTLADEIKSAGMKCPVIAAYTDLRPAAALEVPYLEMQIAYVESLCRLCSKLEATVVRVFTAYETPGQSPHASWLRVVGVLREMCDRAVKHGITIAIQNHHDVALHTAALLELLNDVDRPNCKLGFDAWSPALRGEDLYEAAKLAAPQTAITTNADYIRMPRYRYRPDLMNYETDGSELVRAVPFGTGFIDYRAFFRGLRDGGFDGLATYEMCSPIRGGGTLENLDTYAQTYLRWMRQEVLK